LDARDGRNHEGGTGRTRPNQPWRRRPGLLAEKELAELEKKHERLEQQLKELEDTGQDKFESIKQDLSKDLEEVDKKIEELTTKRAKGKDKEDPRQTLQRRRTQGSRR
jgi:hypothetical protein